MNQLTTGGSVETALEWGKNTHAIITLCWHYFSPMNGKNKSFYNENTTFDLERALVMIIMFRLETMDI